VAHHPKGDQDPKDADLKVDHHPKGDQDPKDADLKEDHHPRADQDPKDQDLKVARHLKGEDPVAFNPTQNDSSSEPCSLIETVTENSIETN
jgi:hypothetical protein